MILTGFFVLKTEGTDQGTDETGSNIKVTFYELDQEKEMIQDAFEIIKTFPFVLTYNGDEFDLHIPVQQGRKTGNKKGGESVIHDEGYCNPQGRSSFGSVQSSFK